MQERYYAPERPEAPLILVLEALSPYEHFVTWKYAEIQGKPRKLPYDPKTGHLASSTNPRTWGSLDQAQKALSTGRYNGLGFVFSEDDPFTGIDIDKCIVDNKLTPEAKELVTQMWSYTELSPSHTGLHILVEGSIPEAGKRKGNVEVYSSQRYFTLTTNHLKIAPDTIEFRQPQLTRLYTSLTALEAPRATCKPQEYQVYVSNDTVLEKAKNAPNGQLFAELYNGGITRFTSKSEADWELLLKLMYWTNDDVSQVRSLFLKSGLVDAKTLSPRAYSTYLDVTIDNILKKRKRL